MAESPEGIIKFNYDWDCRPAQYPDVAAALLGLRQQLRALGWLGVLPDGVGFGNCSLALGPEENRGGFLITASQTGHLSAPGPDICCAVLEWKLANNWVRCRGVREPSSEALTHASLYECDPAFGCVVHIHHREAWERLNGVLPTTRPEMHYGTVGLALEMERLLAYEGLGHVGCLVMGGHQDGILACGADAAETMARLRQWVLPAM